MFWAHLYMYNAYLNQPYSEKLIIVRVNNNIKNIKLIIKICLIYLKNSAVTSNSVSQLDKAQLNHNYNMWKQIFALCISYTVSNFLLRTMLDKCHLELYAGRILYYVL